MSLAKNVLSIVPGLQATSLAIRATQMVPKNPTRMNNKYPMKKFIGRSLGVLVGVALIKPTASAINKL